MGRNFSPETRAKLAELARTNRPRLGTGQQTELRDGVEGKVCRGECQQWLPLSRFARHSSTSGGRRHTCTTCEGRRAYRNNAARIVAQVRKWQAAHPEQFRIIKRAAERRRHGKLVAGPGVSAADLRAILEQYDGRCAYCAAPADTIDHVIPVSRGGLHEPANVVPACKACNFAKHNKTPAEWLGTSEA